MRVIVPAIALRPLVALLVLAAAAAPLRAEGPPRYGFEPGQLLVYEGNEALVSAPDAPIVERSAEIRVVAVAPSGLRRIILTHRHQRFVTRNGQRQPMTAREDVYVVDVRPDGTVPGRGEDSFGVLDRLLPQLPPDSAAASTGWTFAAADVHHECTAVTAGVSDDGPDWRFDVTPRSFRDELNGFSATRHYRVDQGLGVVRRITVDHRHRSKPTRTGTDRLVRIERIDETELADLGRDAGVYLDAERLYRRRVADALGGGTPESAPPALAAALADLEAARGAVRSELLGTRLDAMIAGHRASGPAYAARLRAQAGLVGRPAPDWRLVDLDGREHALADYRGRVVVLDFWYRNCGWCIRAMPQLKELVRRYADRPVAVLGMNIDRKLEDARFVADELELNYPSMRADGQLARAHAVRSYPTLVVIDRNGVTRYVHVGYSGTLADELERVIEGLLGG
ncbi:MAG: TlpA family protein disulfide reductase [Planctomycetota bacterium]